MNVRLQIRPIRIATYLSSYALLALPNAFLATALLFALSVLSRRAVASYLGAVVLFFVSIFVWLVVAEKLGQWELAKIHKHEYVTLKRAILEQINKREGPLPGDEVLRTKSEQDDLRLAHIAGLLAH